MLGIGHQQEAESITIKSSGQFSISDVILERRLGRLPPGRTKNGTGCPGYCSEASVLVAVFELAACCGVEVAQESVGERTAVRLKYLCWCEL